jgi:nicotinamide riboside kinase
MGSNRQVILICGPESSGKSTLSFSLSKRLSVRLLNDYSRFYLMANGSTYTADDVEIMAQIHSRQFNALKSETVFLDSFLINYKIWLHYKFNKRSTWIENQLIKFNPDACLLMKPDLLWEPDPLRESETERTELFHLYEEELLRLKWSYSVIDGEGESRNIKAKATLLDSGLKLDF